MYRTSQVERGKRTTPTYMSLLTHIHRSLFTYIHGSLLTYITSLLTYVSHVSFDICIAPAKSSEASAQREAAVAEIPPNLPARDANAMPPLTRRRGGKGAHAAMKAMRAMVCVCMFVYVYMYMCMYVCIYVYMCTYI